jgi:cell division protein YceG involved in septum cleavage
MNLSKYIGEKNEYNTRTMIWLPKTAISNPSFESVNAVINSKDTPYYYYLHDTTNWQVYYAKTNEEHIKNKKLYIK